MSVELETAESLYPFVLTEEQADGFVSALAAVA